MTAMMVAIPAQAASVLVYESAGACSGQSFDNSGNSATGPVSTSTGPCPYSFNYGSFQVSGTSATSAFTDFGHLEGGGSGSVAMQADRASASKSAGFDSSYSGTYYDDFTVTDGAPDGYGYLRMFYDFSYDGYLTPGKNGYGANFGAVYYLGGSPQVTSYTNSGSWAGATSGFVDYAITRSQATAYGHITGGVSCTAFTYGDAMSGDSDSCSGAINVQWNITGWQVLDSSFQVMSAASIQSASGTTYATETPEPSTVLMLGCAGFVFLVWKARRSRSYVQV